MEQRPSFVEQRPETNRINRAIFSEFQVKRGTLIVETGRGLLTKLELRRIINVDMPPLTAPGKPLSPVSWRLLLLVACVLVFAFALHAKVAVYQQSAAPQTATSAKLWISSEKMSGQPLSSSLSLLWLATLVVLLYSPRTEARIEVVDRAPAVLLARQLFLQRFLRPPPSR